MAKKGKNVRQVRKNIDKSGPQAVDEMAKPQAADVQETSGQKLEAVSNGGARDKQEAVVVEVAPARPSFDLTAYIKSFTWVYPIILIALMLLMAWVRIVPSYDSVFTSWGGGYVNVAQDDAVMQMRLVENTLAHFPTRIMFDPFTHFPYGSTIHFGPLFTLTIAAAALIVGLGNPSPALVETVGAYIPVLLGALCILPTYFIGKKLFGRNAGIVAAATLALLPGSFLGRSMLGFTDHHIAEVLFSAATVAFLVYALDAAKKSGLSLEKIRNKDSASMKALAYSALAGIAFGCYMLSWPGALLIGFMLFVYFVAQSIVNHMKGEPLNYILIVAALLYIIPAVMVLPYSLQDISLQLMYYSITQPVFLGIALVGVGATYAVSTLLRQNKAEAWTFPVTLGGIAVVGLLVAYIIFPQIYALTMAGFNVFLPQGGMLTVAEASPTIFERGVSGNFDVLSTDNLWYGFYWSIAISFVAIFMLAFRVLKNNRPAEMLFLVWNVIMFLATISQVRFTYYFAINAALLTGYFAFAMFRAFDSEKFMEGFRAKVKRMDDVREYLGKHIGQTAVFAILSIACLLVIIYPATSLSLQPGMNPGYSASFIGGMVMAQAEAGPGMPYEWFSSLTWLRDNTPDPQGTVVQPGFDYNGTYAKTFNADGTYQYPASAYGVMSWWDYGHIIEYVAHRIPNANPFQAGIIENNGTDGSAKFFLATDESDGYRNLQDMGSKYVMIDNQMATGKFQAIQKWVNDEQYWNAQVVLNLSSTYQVPLIVDSSKYKSSMMSRLYYDDCNGMSHFRLVYESPGDYYVSTKLADLNQYQQGYVGVPYSAQYLISSDNYSEMFDKYANTIGPAMVYADDYSQFVYDSRPPVKFVKTYEVVKGATITGSAPANSTVTASVKLGIASRTFNYTQSTTADANGKYAMIVPYATDAMKGDGYTSDVTPLSQYTLTSGNTTTTVAVPERAVANGETIQVSENLQG
jgi:oligosaccharyl transferase (archaeosortase A-associated)